MNLHELSQVQHPQADLEAVLADPANRRLLEALETFARTLTLYGYSVPVYRRSALADLAFLTPQKKEQIRASYVQWNQFIQPRANDQVPIEVDISREKELAQQVLKFYGMQVHEDFWKTVENDQLIEIYGLDGIQLYRNLNFFKLCGYSLLEMSIYEWYKLWERPSTILKEMSVVAQKVMTEKVDLMAYKVPRHVLRELRQANATENYVPSAFAVEFKYVATLTRGIDPSPAGAIVSSRGERIAFGGEAHNIHFV